MTSQKRKQTSDVFNYAKVAKLTGAAYLVEVCHIRLDDKAGDCKLLARCHMDLETMLSQLIYSFVSSASGNTPPLFTYLLNYEWGLSTTYTFGGSTDQTFQHVTNIKLVKTTGSRYRIEIREES